MGARFVRMMQYVPIKDPPMTYKLCGCDSSNREIGLSKKKVGMN